jgi:hypothetical protein
VEHRIEIKPARRQLNGRWIGEGRYYVNYAGERVGVFLSPACEAARWLLDAGLASEADTLTIYRNSRPSLTGSIGRLARLRVIENEPGWSRWRPLLEGALPPYGAHGEALEPLMPEARP